jgi:hypothetical protein
LAVQHSALTWVEKARDQRQIMIHLGAPLRGRHADQATHPADGSRQRCPGGMRGGDQFAIEPAPMVFATAVLDVYRTALGQAPMVTPADHQGSRRFGRLP